MGIGALAFLEFVEEAVGGQVDIATQERVIRSDYFVSPRMGLGFVKPSTWHLHAFEEFFPMLAGQKLRDGSDDDEEFAEHARNLVAVVSKYPVGPVADGESTRFSPSITIFRNAEDREDSTEDFMTVISSGIEYFRGMLRDYVVLEPPRFETVSMCPAAWFTAQFTFEHRAMTPTVVRDRTLLIDQGHRLYSVHLYDSPATGEAVGGEFDAFVGSLHLA